MKASVLSSPIAKEVKVSSCILSDIDKCQLEREPVADSTSREAKCPPGAIQSRNYRKK